MNSVHTNLFRALFSKLKSAIRLFPSRFADLFDRAFLLGFLKIANSNFVSLKFLSLI